MGKTVTGTKPAILIVEDEAFIRHDLIDFFEDAGFIVFDAENADDAIEVMAGNPHIRIVLTDVHMPGSMDGLRLAHVIRERHPPTLLLIASGAAKLQPGDLPIGATFIPKPFNPHAVLATIRSSEFSG